MSIFNTHVIHLREVSVFRATQDKFLSSYIGNTHTLTLRYGGHARFFSNDNILIMDSLNGAITFVPWNYPHIHQHIEPSEIISIHFRSDELDECKPFVFYPLDAKKFHYLFNDLYNIWCEDPMCSTVRVLAATYKIFESIIDDSELQQIGGYSMQVLKAVKYMRKNVSNEKLSIVECANAADISEVYLRVLFRKELSMSPTQYLLNFRISYAKNLLDSGYYSVMEIAALSGFSSPSYFCRVFKENTGISPLEYKKLL